MPSEHDFPPNDDVGCSANYREHPRAIPNSTRIESFNLLYRRLYIPVYRFACGFVSREEAEDITADSFLKLWKSRIDFSIEPKVRTWLNVVTRNSCIDLLMTKKKQAARLAELRNLTRGFEEINTEEFEIVEALVSRLYAEIEKLPTKRKIIFKMAYLEGKTTLEIAAILGVSESTVSNQRVKAMRALKVAFKTSHLVFFFLLVRDLP